MYNELIQLLSKPAFPRSANSCFWNDDHISENLLKAHLNAGWDAASRKHSFIEHSAAWIADIAPSGDFPALLDLGCGPGLYAEHFHKLGYAVTGIDFSNRSIEYARSVSKQKNSDITYINKSYLDIDFRDCFDIVTIIYCDYGVMPETDRKVFRDSVFKALRKGGKFILDCFSDVYFSKEKEESSFEVCENGGFWSPDSYIALNALWRYTNCMSTLKRHVILSREKISLYDFYERRFTKESLEAEITDSGFSSGEYFADAAGKPYSKKSETLCGVFTK